MLQRNKQASTGSISSKARPGRTGDVDTMATLYNTANTKTFIMFIPKTKSYNVVEIPIELRAVEKNEYT